MNSRPCGFGYDYDYFVGDENLNDGSHYGIDEFSGGEPFPYEQSPWQPSPSSYYDVNPSYNAYHPYEHDDSYHGYTSQPPPFYTPYSQPPSYFHQLPAYDPNLYSPYAYPCDDYEQATLESPPLQHFYPPTQVPMDDALGIILQEQEELQTAFTSFTSTLQEFTSLAHSIFNLSPFSFSSTSRPQPPLPRRLSRHHHPPLPSLSSLLFSLSPPPSPTPPFFFLLRPPPLLRRQPPLGGLSFSLTPSMLPLIMRRLDRIDQMFVAQGLELPPLPESSGSDEETDLQTEGIPADEPAHMDAPPQTQESQPVPQPQPEPTGVPIPDPQD
nr:extensin-like [Arachis hypogaea]